MAGRLATPYMSWCHKTKTPYDPAQDFCVNCLLFQYADFVRPAVIEFAKQMEMKLQDAAQKEPGKLQGWSHLTDYELFKGFNSERMEMLQARKDYLKYPTKEGLKDYKEEIIDMANYLMMLYDNLEE